MFDFNLEAKYVQQVVKDIKENIWITEPATMMFLPKFLPDIEFAVAIMLYLIFRPRD